MASQSAIGDAIQCFRHSGKYYYFTHFHDIQSFTFKKIETNNNQRTLIKSIARTRSKNIRDFQLNVENLIM